MPFKPPFVLRETGEHRADFRSQERHVPFDTADDVTARHVRLGIARDRAARRRIRRTSIEVLPVRREALGDNPALRDYSLVDEPSVVLRTLRTGGKENRRITALHVFIDERSLKQP